MPVWNRIIMFRCTFLFVVVSFLSLTQISCDGHTSVSSPTTTENTSRSDLESGLVSQNRSLIVRELGALPEHDWAGCYYEGDGLGVSIRLHLAPENGAALTWHGCLGLYDQNCGPVQQTDRLIKVAWEIQNPNRLYTKDEYLAVRWGKRRYLIPPEDLLEFSSAITTGMEPRTKAHGQFLLRQGDEELPVEGLPQLPPGFEKYLSMNSIKANFKTLGAVTERTSSQDDTVEEVTQHVTLNVGEVDGVLPKMQFEVTKPRGAGRVVVTKVTQRESEAVLTSSRSKGEQAIEPSQEWELSTPIW